MSDNTNVDNLAPLESVHDLQTLEAAFEASGRVVRKNLEDGFLGYLVSAEHLYLRKCDVQHVAKVLKPFYDWLVTLKISPRTARRMCAFYLTLKVERPDILEIVDLLYLENVSATGLQVVVKFEEDINNGVDTGLYLRSQIKREGIFLYFRGAEESPYDLADLTSRQITLLAFPEKATKAAVDSVDSEKSPSPSYAGAQGSAVIEGTDSKDEEIRRLKLRCKELDELVLSLNTKLASYKEMVPKAEFDELGQKFFQYRHERTKMPIDGGGNPDRADFGNEPNLEFDEDELLGVSGYIADPGYVDSMDSVLAA